MPIAVVSAMCRASLGLLLLTLLGACAQMPDKVAVGIGTAAYMPDDAAGYAKLYLPYARMASLAYVNPRPGEGDGARYCPTEKWLARPESWDERHSIRDKASLPRWLHDLTVEGWHCVDGGGAVKCPPGLLCSRGLQYHVWIRGSSSRGDARRHGCSEAVVAFRGTDPGDPGDVLSNLHWLVGAWAFDDYAQARLSVSRALDRIGCRPAHIIATGHSLGGGLAQHAGFSDRRIDYVYAFDSSPVTGFFAVPEAERSAASDRLGIDRIYEAGEILSFARYAASAVFPSPQCRPRVRIVRFQIGPFADPVTLHNMPGLTTAFERLALAAKPGAHLPIGYPGARDCNLALASQN